MRGRVRVVSVPVLLLLLLLLLPLLRLLPPLLLLPLPPPLLVACARASPSKTRGKTRGETGGAKRSLACLSAYRDGDGACAMPNARFTISSKDPSS